MKRVIDLGCFTLIAALVLATPLARAADNGCKAAYDDGTPGADCKVRGCGESQRPKR